MDSEAEEEIVKAMDEDFYADFDDMENEMAAERKKKKWVKKKSGKKGKKGGCGASGEGTDI